MESILVRPEFVIFALVLVVESVKALFLGTATAYCRGKTGKFINREDADWLGGEVVDNDAPEPGRLSRAHRNTIENLVPFALLGTVYLVVGANDMAGLTYFIAFLISRQVHTYAYLNRRPMLRRNAYSVAWLIQLAMAIHVAVGIIGGLLYEV